MEKGYFYPAEKLPNQEANDITMSLWFIIIIIIMQERVYAHVGHRRCLKRESIDFPGVTSGCKLLDSCVGTDCAWVLSKNSVCFLNCWAVSPDHHSTLKYHLWMCVCVTLVHLCLRCQIGIMRSIWVSKSVSTQHQNIDWKNYWCIWWGEVCEDHSVDRVLA